MIIIKTKYRIFRTTITIFLRVFTYRFESINSSLEQFIIYLQIIILFTYTDRS